ncbi:hypothetical protein RFI_24045, partial [Reticulomyxa filosa]
KKTPKKKKKKKKKKKEIKTDKEAHEMMEICERMEMPFYVTSNICTKLANRAYFEQDYARMVYWCCYGKNVNLLDRYLCELAQHFVNLNDPSQWYLHLEEVINQSLDRNRVFQSCKSARLCIHLRALFRCLYDFQEQTDQPDVDVSFYPNLTQFRSEYKNNRNDKSHLSTMFTPVKKKHAAIGVAGDNNETFADNDAWLKRTLPVTPSVSRRPHDSNYTKYSRKYSTTIERIKAGKKTFLFPNKYKNLLK